MAGRSPSTAWSMPLADRSRSPPFAFAICELREPWSPCVQQQVEVGDWQPWAGERVRRRQHQAHHRTGLPPSSPGRPHPGHSAQRSPAADEARPEQVPGKTDLGVSCSRRYRLYTLPRSLPRKERRPPRRLCPHHRRRIHEATHERAHRPAGQRQSRERQMQGIRRSSKNRSANRQSDHANRQGYARGQPPSVTDSCRLVLVQFRDVMSFSIVEVHSLFRYQRRVKKTKNRKMILEN
jgi:hypothetical protein